MCSKRSYTKSDLQEEMQAVFEFYHHPNPSKNVREREGKKGKKTADKRKG